MRPYRPQNDENPAAMMARGVVKLSQAKSKLGICEACGSGFSGYRPRRYFEVTPFGLRHSV